MKVIRFILVLLLVTICEGNAFSQDSKSNWSVGIGAGYRFNFMNFSDIDKNYFPTNEATSNGMFSVFFKGEFFKEGCFAIRPQLSFLSRGGRLKDINSASYTNDQKDINYTVKTHYIDVRVPLMYQFLKATSVVRPYVYVAPVLGLTTGGNIRWQEEFEDESIKGYDLDVTKANMSSIYFAGQIGVGVNFAIPVANDHCYLGVEADYEYGFTNTYSSKEKDGEAIDVVHLFNNNYKLNGSRHFSGVEIQATITIPFSVFKSKKVKTVEQPVQPELPELPVVVREEIKPCYTLEEIIDMIEMNEDIEGKTFCAIDAIEFDFAKSTIKEDSYGYLDKVASTIKRANKCVEIKGHTDNVGSKKTNMNLSKARAEAVMDYLINKGVDPSKLKYSYYGYSQPLSTNDTEEGRALNRRVEFTITNNF